jgi:hypothetical protein
MASLSRCCPPGVSTAHAYVSSSASPAAPATSSPYQRVPALIARPTSPASLSPTSCGHNPCAGYEPAVNSHPAGSP